MAPRTPDISSDERAAEGPGGVSPSPAGGHQLLVVTGEPITGQELRSQVERHLGERDRAQVHVIAPAFTDSRFKHGFGDVDEAVRAAKERLERSLEEIRGAGLQATGAIGDSDPTLAIDDALAAFPADEILIVTHPDDESRWLEDKAFERAKDRFSQPVTHVVVERDGSGDAHVREVEEAPAGAADPAVEDPSARSWNLPPMSPRDLLGIAMAIIGTGVLIALAGTCEGSLNRETGDFGLGIDQCGARLLIAGGIGLINAAHVVGLLLFQSTRYRGFWESFFATISLVGTPIAIGVSLALG